MVRAEPWLEDDDGAWDALAASADDLFQTSAVTRAAAVFGAATRRIRIVAPDGEPTAAVALLEIGSRRLPAADRVFARRFQVGGGPVVLGEAPGSAALAVAGVEVFAAERAATETDWKPTWPAGPGAPPFAQRGWETTRFGIAWRDLPADPSAVPGSLSQGHRTGARQAVRQGMTVREAAGAEEVGELVDASFARSGQPPRNREFFLELWRGLERAGALRALVVEDEEGPASAVLAARCGRAVFELFHGRAERPTGSASNLLHQELLQRAVAEGCTRFHDTDAGLEGGGGAPVREGITRFKRLMGCRVDPCERGRLVHRPGAKRVREMALDVYGLLRGGSRNP